MTESQKKDNKKIKIKRPWWRRILRFLIRTVLVIILLLFAIILFVRSPWGQDIIVSEVTDYISKRTNTKVTIEKLFITFSGEIELCDLYLEDQAQDTLLYSKLLLVDIPIWPIIVGDPVSVDGLEWNGLRCNIVRKDSVNGFNYQFLIDAFASDSPETEPESSEPLKIFIGSVNLSDFKVKYEDAVGGMHANINLGNFHFQGKNFDLEKMNFKATEIALENTIINYLQTKPIPPSEPSDAPLPYLSLDDLKLNNVIVNYNSQPDSIAAQLNLADLHLQVPKADLAQQDIEISEFILNNSTVKVKINAKKKTESTPTENITTPAESIPFIWPDWNVTVGSIALLNNNINYQFGEEVKSTTNFNPDYIVLNEFNFQAKDIALSKNQSAKLSLENISFQEESGLDLSQLSFSAAMDATKFSIDQLILKTGNSSINSNLSVQYTSIQRLIDSPQESPLFIDLKDFNIDLNDAFKFQPELKQNEYLKKLARHSIKGQIKANGNLEEVTLSTFLVNWGENTKINSSGQFQNLLVLDIENFVANIDNFTFQSNRADLTNFVNEKELGITIPKNILLKSQFYGKLADVKAKLKLTTTDGTINIDGRYRQQDEIVFDSKINVVNLKLNKILKNPELGLVAFDMNVSGHGKTVNELNAKLSSQFKKLELNGYDFSALQLDGELSKGDGDILLKFKDRNLDLAIDSKIQLDSVSPKIALNFNLEGADLYALGLSEKQVKTKLILNANFHGNSEIFDFNSHVSEGVAVYDNKNYYLGLVDLNSHVTQDSVALVMKSNFLNGQLHANAGIDRIVDAVQNQLKNYFTDSIVSYDTIAKPVRLQMNMKLSETNLITDFLVPEIKAMDTLDFNVDFNQEEKTLTANLSLPYIEYDDNTMDSLQFSINSTTKDAKFKFGFNKLDADPILMNRTYFDGDFQRGLLNLHLHAQNGDQEIYVIKSEITGSFSDLKVHIDPEKIILNSKEWTIPNDNELTFQTEVINAKNFVLSRNEQSIRLATDLMQTTQDNIGVEFKNFKLANFLALFNEKDLLTTGDLQGSIVAIDPLGNIGLKADFSIDNLTALDTPLGKLTLNAESENSDIYSIDLDILGDDLDLSLTGDYSLQDLGSELDFKLNLNKIGMKTIANLSGESLKDASGHISGEFAIQGNVSSPEYKGFVQFNDAVFNVSDLNAKFLLTNDKINIDNTAITLNQFAIQDEQKNTFTLNGAILTKDISDPTLDLSIKSKKFQALNSTKSDNELFYGTVIFSMDGTIFGKMSAPKVDVTLGINEKTNFTYVILDAQAELEKSDGIVEFVNKTDPDNILTRTDDSTNIAVFGGIDLHAKLKIHKDAVFNIIIDPKTGDKLSVVGKGDLVLNIEKNGLTTLSGRYDINKGSYNLSLYNLVKREFELEPGSSIVWRGGGPMDADLNVTAKYSIETSASALMASQTSGASEAEKNKYRQKLPFQVFLNVKGELDQPELSFNLGMPEDSRGAIDGTVYGRIKQLNNEEDELNKQVFSLLVLEKFYPNSGSDGSSGGAVSLVRQNVNDAISDQLNVFSNRLTGNTGVELDFGLNSYTDYQGESVQQRTDLNVSAQKKLLDDRLIVQVGSSVNVEGTPNSGEENQVVGNVSIQYLLTKDGHWRLKGFRNSEYENVIDGQVFVNGISLIFQRQFNKFNELLNEPVENEESTRDEKNDETEENTEENSKKDKN